MPVLNVKNFSGVAPVVGDRALPDGFAAEAVNTWLYGQELRGARPPTDLEAVLSTTRKVLRVPKRTVGGDPAFPGVIPPPSYLGDSVWVQFADHDTDIVKGQLVEDQYERWYFCSPSTGPRFNTYARMQAGLAAYKLGVPGPNIEIDADGNNPDKPTILSIEPVRRSGDLFEIEFRIAATGGTPSYANPGGTGDRTASITVTSNVAFGWGGVDNVANAARLINGNLVEAGLTIADLSQGEKTIQFDFTTDKIIDEFRWVQDGSRDYGVWDWEASTDAISWDLIGSGRLGGAADQTYPVPNTDDYRYYRLRQSEQNSNLMVTRSYLYTWANEFGEESAPSLPVVGAGSPTGVWTIGNIKDPVAIADYPAYTKKYLYRTITGASGQTTFYRVAEVPIGTTTYEDDTLKITDAVLANNLRLQSTTWAPPPATLQGWIAMPNGFLIGFDANNVYMSEPYRFHAWPPEYKQASEYEIVGLGILGQTCVVCTEGFPATITGSKPAVCSFTKATTGEPCLSRGSIVSTPQGVIYASQNGLQLVSPSGIQNVTEKLITRDEWIRDYAPQFIRAVRYQNGYLALRMPPAGARSAFFLDPTELKVALTEFSDFENVVNLNVDYWSGEVFVLEAGQILRWDTPSDDIMPVLWKSKEYQFPYPENFGAYAIYWDEARYSDVDYGLSVMPMDEKVRFKVYADRVVVYDQEVPVNGRPIRLPSGFKSDIWQFEIRARAPVYSMHVASTMKELRNV